MGKGGGGSKFLHFYIEIIHVEKDSVKKAETCVKAQTVQIEISSGFPGEKWSHKRGDF